VRDLKINVLYYPEMYAPEATLKKALLLFDELHFIDQPSFSFRGQGGLTGAISPYRQSAASLREGGAPFYVHPAPGTSVVDDLHDQIAADVNDLEFLKRFQKGLETSPAFRGSQIPTANYGAAGDQGSVARKLATVELVSALEAYESPIALFEDTSLLPLSFSNPGGPVGCAKLLIFQAFMCSAKLNFALHRSTKEGFFPLADANPYGDLLGAKYARAINKLEPTKNKIQVTDLSFAIFDELIPSELLEKLTLKDVIRYRKSSEKAREAFLEHLDVLQAKLAAIGPEGDYAGAIDKMVTTEILPAARNFKNKLQTIRETQFGAVAKGAVTYLGSSAALSLFTSLSWENLLKLAGAVGAYVVSATVDANKARCAARRDCSISYILSLDK